MANYFSNFSLNKITNSIATAAHKTQDTLTNAISNVNLNDPQTKLAIKARTRYLQESLGTVDEISKLPPQYESLEKKTDALEKCCKRMLIVTKTFEMEGYDYPPNLSESISDWWTLGKDGWFGTSAKKNNKEPKQDTGKKENSEPFIPRSFAQALSKAAKDSSLIFPGLEHASSVDASVSTEAHDGVKTDLDTDIDEEYADIEEIKKMFETFSKCYRNIDENKEEMDTSIAKEFNAKLEKLINEDFKKVHELRRKVEDSRLKFDTVLYEIKLNKKKLDEKTRVSESVENDASQNIEAKGDEVAEESATNKEAESKTNLSEDGVVVATPIEENKEVEPEAEETKPSEDPETPSEEDKLLEQLEDEFVSNTSAAVEVMGEITDCSELLSLLKLFQNYQLVYFRQCVLELETSLKCLTELEAE